MWLVEATIINVDHLDLANVKERIIDARSKGRFAAVMSNEEAARRGFLELQQQDLTKIHDWKDVK